MVMSKKKVQTETVGESGFDRNLVKAYKESITGRAAEKSPMSNMVLIKIADIKTGSRIRQKFVHVKSLAADIEANGLKYPIVVTPNHILVDGETRMKAFKLLGRDAIPAIIEDSEDVLELEVALNVERGSFDYFECVVGVDRLIDKHRRSVGRPTKDDGSGATPKFGVTFKDTEELVDWAAKKLGLSGKSEYYRRKRVKEDTIKEVQTAVSDGIISSSYAYSLSLLSKDTQLTTMRTAREVPDVDAKQLNQYFREHSIKKNVARLGGDVDNPDNPDEVPEVENLYNLVALAPNFPKDKAAYLSKLPIHRHAGKDTLICLACRDSMLVEAVKLILEWNLVYHLSVKLESGTGSVINGLERKGSEPVHILMCSTTKWKGDIFADAKIASTLPCKNPRENVMEVISSVFGEHACGYMLDMIAKEPHGTWSTLDSIV
jgi:ParB family chromosome partitioning protein